MLRVQIRQPPQLPAHEAPESPELPRVASSKAPVLKQPRPQRPVLPTVAARWAERPPQQQAANSIAPGEEQPLRPQTRIRPQQSAHRSSPCKQQDRSRLPPVSEMTRDSEPKRSSLSRQIHTPIRQRPRSGRCRVPKDAVSCWCSGRLSPFYGSVPVLAILVLRTVHSACHCEECQI